MRCPLNKTVVREYDGSWTQFFEKCLGPECEWWNPSLEMCCLRTISWSLAEELAARKRDGK